jgi:cytochrome c oxidase subunit 2
MTSSFFPILHQASTIASQVDAITVGLLLFCGFIVTLVFGLLVIFGIKYRKGSSCSRVIEAKGENTLEWSWTLATFLIFMGFFIWGSVPYLRMHVEPSGSTEIMVVAKQWMWKFQHSNGLRELNDLHIPVGKPFTLVMTSEDVIHSFFVPDFRIKQDVLPGRYTRLWFEASEPGTYHLFCTQYCGTMHSSMMGKVIVMEASDYDKWLQNGYNHTNGEQQSMSTIGRRLFTRYGCISCHGINPGVQAPALAGIFGKPVGLSDGTQVMVDENYIRESILNPGAKIVQGYQNVMPSFKSILSEDDTLNLIAYIKSMGGTPQSETPGGVQ